MTFTLIRCDASLSIGSGHVIRCRTLARELQRRGEDPIFISRHQEGDLINLLKQEFRVLGLPEQTLSCCKNLAGSELYSAWLGCSQAKDAVDCLQALSQAGITHAKWLIVDHYGLDASWQIAMSAGLDGSDSRTKFLVIDDLANRKHHADILLDQNFFGNRTDQRYNSLLPPQCRRLLGPHYALLGPEYAQISPLLPERNKVSRVLVFYGGVDRKNITSQTLEALMDPTLKNLEVDVVLGRQSSHRQKVEKLVAQRPHTTLHEPIQSLAGLIARADLAIGAGGTTTWERACLGLPSLVVAIAANQLPITQVLDKAGHIELLGDEASVNTKKIRSAIMNRINNLKKVGSAKNLTDGWGASRLATAMLGVQGNIKLRSATENDEALLLRWANDFEVRSKSFSPKPIGIVEHSKWFHKSIINSNRIILIAVGKDGCPLGQIRFDRQNNGPESTQEVVQMYQIVAYEADWLRNYSLRAYNMVQKWEHRSRLWLKSYKAMYRAMLALHEPALRKNRCLED